ncbi:hypothetical protein K502DRAFT_326830 [Neoconidiobolus thromboides FSU 785]|nr:hypothetical protein K502DRAFT_326830 [Neoconidiobolus thromboides FSU 785]
MEQKFDCLPFMILYEIFNLVNPEELFNLRLLNKSLYNIIDIVIKRNLAYSVYSSSVVGRYKHHQQKIIKENKAMMKHLNIYNNNIDYINYHPNITSIEYCKSGYILNNDNHITIKLPRLKRLTLTSLHGSCLRFLEIFSSHLSQIEAIEVKGYECNSNEFIHYFSPNALKSFKIHSYRDLNIDGLDILKTKFHKLEKLQFKSDYFIHTPSTFNPNMNFTSGLELEIEGHFNKEFSIKYFGNLEKFKSIKLIDKSENFLGNENNLKLIRNINIITLGYFESTSLIRDLRKLTVLKEVYVRELSKELLNSISLLSSIQTIHIDSIYSANKDIFNKSDLCDSNKSRYEQYLANENDIIKNKFIKQITVNTFKASLDEVISIISLFPNLRLIKIRKFNLKSIDKKINYKHATPLLLVAPIPYHANIDFCNEFGKNSMFNWLKL